jgi:hypothetical protein
VKAKVAAGKAWVKGKVEKGKAWVNSKAAQVRDRLRGRGGKQTEPGAAGEAAANKRLLEDVVRTLRAPIPPNRAPANFIEATDQRAAQLERERQREVRDGGRLSVKRTDVKPNSLLYSVEVQRMAVTVPIPVTYRNFLGVDGEKAACADSHIEDRHIRASMGRQVTTSDLALRLLQNTNAFSLPSDPNISANAPRNAGYFASKAQADAYITTAFSAVQTNWASIAAAMAASNYTSYLVPSHHFRFVAAQGLQLTPMLLQSMPGVSLNAKANQLRAQYNANPETRPLFPNDPNFTGPLTRPWCVWSGGEDWSGSAVGEVEAPIIIAFKAKLSTPSAPVPGNWYVDSAYPVFE